MLQKPGYHSFEGFLHSAANWKPSFFALELQAAPLALFPETVDFGVELDASRRQLGLVPGRSVVRKARQAVVDLGP